MTNAWRIINKGHENCGEVFAQVGRQPDSLSVRLARPDLEADWRKAGWRPMPMRWFPTPRCPFPTIIYPIEGWLEPAHPDLIGVKP